MNEEEPSWRYELDRAIAKRNRMMRKASEVSSEDEELQVQREKLQKVLEAGDQRPKLFGVKYGTDGAKKAFRKLVKVRDRIEELNAQKEQIRHDWRDADYAINFIREKLKTDKEGVL